MRFNQYIKPEALIKPFAEVGFSVKVSNSAGFNDLFQDAGGVIVSRM